MKRCPILAAFIFGLLSLSSKDVFSQHPVINEFLANPSSYNDETEWIELYNPHPFSFELSQYLLDDAEAQGSHPYLLSGEIAPYSYIVIHRSESNLILNNDQDSVRLLVASTLEIVDQHHYQDAKTDISLGRIPDGTGEFQALSMLTPGYPNQQSTSPTIFLSPTPISSQFEVEISEIVSCAQSSGSEWIELYNPSNNHLTLIDWKLVDIANNEVRIAASIPSKEYEVVELSRDIINNTGDTISLKDNLNTIHTTVTLPACSVGTSFIYHQGEWKQTWSPSPGYSNQLSTPTPTLTSSPTLTTTPKPSATPKTSINSAYRQDQESSDDLQSRTISTLSNLPSLTSSRIASVAGLFLRQDQEIATQSASASAQLRTPDSSKHPLWIISASGAFLLSALVYYRQQHL